MYADGLDIHGGSNPKLLRSFLWKISSFRRRAACEGRMFTRLAPRGFSPQSPYSLLTEDRHISLGDPSFRHSCVAVLVVLVVVVLVLFFFIFFLSIAFSFFLLVVVVSCLPLFCPCRTWAGWKLLVRILLPKDPQAIKRNQPVLFRCLNFLNNPKPTIYS